MKLTFIIPLLLIALYPAISHSQSKKLENISVTENSITVGTVTVSYQATTGYFPLLTEGGEKEADIFFVYYKRTNVKDVSSRPLTFAFNGGPGSPSCWIHLGALGPYRIQFDDKGLTPAPPYSYEMNNESWIDLTDMVFIDPVYTGFSRPAADKDKGSFMGYQKDISYIADFIRQFINEFNRWSSPKFIAGESYGSIRAVGLINYLQEYYAIYPNGLMLISGLMNYGTIDTSGGNELPYILRLPSLAATSFYHKKLSGESNLDSLLRKVETFAEKDYLSALFKGNQISEIEKSTIVEKLKDYTGLSEDYIRTVNLRFSIGEVNKELLKKDNYSFGRLDSKVKGHEIPRNRVTFSFDPSFDPLIRAPYLSVACDYIKNKLNFNYNQLNYDIISGRTYPWDFNASNQFLDVTEELSQVMTKNPTLKVWVSGGIFDLGTPYYAAEYSLKHLWIHHELTKNISTTWYKGGHMFYHDKAILKQFKRDAALYFNR